MLRPVSSKLHLAVSVLVIIPVALAYGVCPQKTMPWLFGFQVDVVNLAGIFRAMMGLYLGMCTIWIMGIVIPRLWFTATVTNVAFMGGLALGRLISLAIDGMPNIYFVVGLVLEAVLAIWGLRNLQK